MTTTAELLTQGSLRLQSGRGPGSSNPEAWKSMVGNKPVSARFTLLPNTKPRMSALGTSLVIQIALAAFFVIVPLLFPQQMIPSPMYMVTEIAGPPLDIPTPPPPKPPPVAKVKAQPPPPPVEKPAPKVEAVKYFAPPKIVPPKPKVRQVEADLPKVNDTFQPLKMELASNQPARPREPVKTGLMTGGSSAPPTIDKPLPLDKVQTGGFGDPQGLTGPGNPNKRANIAQFGNPALPSGPGYGNGTGGANGARGTVASTGFGNGVAIPPPGGGGRRAGSVQSTGFANQNDQVVEAPKKKADDALAVESVVILAKPKPLYSAEALKLNLEGEVLLDVIFPASGGEVHVNRVVKGLGHGLDESAMRAAQQIKYKPALSNGHPVDFPAVIHIVFQMAY
jgi:outer membrane biosynthesis protein TonB